MKDLAPLQYPKLFQGVFARRRESFIPLVEEARRVLHTLPVPAPLRPFYDTVIRDNPQPSFLLLPLLFLATAEASGGIQAKHRSFLPVFMLSMEACAIADDTVDRTPMRSGRLSFPLRFGETSSTPFVSSLVALVAQESARIDPRVLDLTMGFFVELFACQLWERHNLYPPEDLYERWLANRYRQSVLGAFFALDSALLLSGREPTPLSVLEPFGRIFQDVDDIVNILEDRRSEGENDDVLMGAVTKPLMVTLEKHPSLRADMSSLWEFCRATTGASAAAMHKMPAHTRTTIERLYRPVRQALLDVGVPDTVAQLLSDYRTCVVCAPPELRPAIQEMTYTWVERLRRCKGIELVTEEQLRHALEDMSQVAA
jgi:hypothetical protein